MWKPRSIGISGWIVLIKMLLLLSRVRNLEINVSIICLEVMIGFIYI